MLPEGPLLTSGNSETYRETTAAGRAPCGYFSLADGKRLLESTIP